MLRCKTNEAERSGQDGQVVSFKATKEGPSGDKSHWGCVDGTPRRREKVA